MIFYLDGDVNVPVSAEKKYSSIYSGTPAEGVQLIELNNHVQKEINFSTFNEISDFYNKYYTQFQGLNDSLGVDIWFLEQFRLYFNYRNFCLKLASINVFLEEHPNGFILTSDKKLELFFSASRLEYVHGRKKKDKKQGLQDFVKEIVYVLSNFKVVRNEFKGNIILSNPSDNINGKDKRFGVLENNYPSILIRNIFSHHRKSKLLVQSKTWNSDSILSSYILSLKWAKDLFVFFKLIQKVEVLFKSKLELTSSEKIINQLFWENKKSFGLYYIRYKSFSSFFKKNNKIKSVLLSDENSPQQKVIQYAARNNNIKIFGFQHGTIHDLHPAYIYSAYKHKPVLPDVTFTWGEYFTKLLVSKGGYNTSQVVTVGRISQLNEIRKRNELITDSKKIILYASQPQRDLSLRTKMLRDVLLTADKFKDKYQCVIRPHPAEVEDDFFDKIAKEIGCRNYIIDRISDLKTHFELCDILINSFSTVGSEFAGYKKPMFVLDYLEQDLMGYVKYGIGIPIRGLNDLNNILSKESIKIDSLAHDNFVKQFFYKDDVLAGERVLKYIDGSGY